MVLIFIYVPWPTVGSYTRNRMQDGSGLLATFAPVPASCSALPSRTAIRRPSRKFGLLSPWQCSPSRTAFPKVAPSILLKCSPPPPQNCNEKTFPGVSCGILLACFPKQNSMRRPARNCVGHMVCPAELPNWLDNSCAMLYLNNLRQFMSPSTQPDPF